MPAAQALSRTRRPPTVRIDDLRTFGISDFRGALRGAELCALPARGSDLAWQLQLGVCFAVSACPRAAVLTHSRAAKLRKVRDSSRIHAPARAAAPGSRAMSVP